MKTRAGSAVAAGSVVAAVISSLFVGVRAASAGPESAPPVTSTPDESFVVPYTLDPRASSIELVGLIRDGQPSDNLNDFGVFVTCRDDPTPRFVDFFEPMGLVTGTQKFHGTLPVYEQGEQCTIHSSAPLNRSLAFDDPISKPSDSGAARLYFSGTVVATIANGGL